MFLGVDFGCLSLVLFTWVGLWLPALFLLSVSFGYFVDSAFCSFTFLVSWLRMPFVFGCFVLKLWFWVWVSGLYKVWFLL